MPRFPNLEGAAFAFENATKFKLLLFGADNSELEV